MEASTTSPESPASAGRPRVRWVPLRSAAGCGHSSPARAPQGCPAALLVEESSVPVGPTCVLCSSTSLALALVFGPRWAAFCCALWCVAAARDVRTVCCSCLHLATLLRRVARQTQPLDERATNLVEPVWLRWLWCVWWLLWLFQTRPWRNSVYVNRVLANCAREPSMAKNSSPSRATKTGAQLRDNPEERGKGGKNREKSIHRRHNQHCFKSCEYPSLLHNWNVHCHRR